MAPPNVPVAVQVNWSGSTTWNYWEQTNSTFLTGCLQEVEIVQGASLYDLAPDTCRLVCTDPGWDLVPGAPFTVLDADVLPGPNGPQVRVLEQSALGSGVWTPKFFGTMTEITPTPSDDYPATVTVLLESPLRRLAEQTVTLLARPAGSAVFTALAALCAAVHLAGDYLVMDAWYRHPALPADWGGGEARFGTALVELLSIAGAVAVVEPRYATASGQVDWRLHISQPTTTTSGSFSAAAGDIHGGSSVVFGGELP